MYAEGSIRVPCSLHLGIEKYLMMKVKGKDGVWNILPHPEMSLLEVAGNSFALPQMWGRFSTLAAREIAEERKGYSIIITDNEHFKDTIVKNKASIPLPTNASIKGLRYGFLNTKAAHFNNHSNYSTNHTDAKEGKDPQKSFSVKNDKSTVYRIPTRSSVHSTLVSAYYHRRRGALDYKFFHDVTWDHYMYSIYPDSSITAQEDELKVKLHHRDRLPSSKNPKASIKKHLSEYPVSQQVDVVIEHTKATTNDTLLDDSVSQTFLMKGYARVLKRLHFGVGMITVNQ